MDLSTPAELTSTALPVFWKPADQLKLAENARVEFWNVYAPRLHKLGRLSEEDKAGLIRCCKVYGQLQVAEMDIAIRGQQVEMPLAGGHGIYLQTNPSVNIAKSCDDRLRRWLLAFGLVPAARKKLAPVEAPKVESKPGGLRDFNAKKQSAVMAADAKVAAANAREAKRPAKKRPAPKKSKGKRG